jgi:hypothetical protein
MRLTDEELRERESVAMKCLIPDHWLRLVLRELIERRIYDKIGPLPKK